MNENKTVIDGDFGLLEIKEKEVSEGTVIIVKKKYLVIDFDWLGNCVDVLIKTLQDEYGIPYKIVEVVELEE